MGFCNGAAGWYQNRDYFVKARLAYALRTNLIIERGCPFYLAALVRLIITPVGTSRHLIRANHLPSKPSSNSFPVSSFLQLSSSTDKYLDVHCGQKKCNHLPLLCQLICLSNYGQSEGFHWQIVNTVWVHNARNQENMKGQSKKL